MSDTSDTSVSRSGSSDTRFRKARNNGAKTKFERDIEAAINRGVSSCKNVMHWRVISVPGGDNWTDVAIKHPRTILNMMAPGPAKCMCERTSCQWAWTSDWNHKGMYTTQWVLEGQEYKGIPPGKDAKDGPRHAAKRVWPMHHSAPEHKIKVLERRFPEWHFISNNLSSHDHVVSHYSAKIGGDRFGGRLEKGTVEQPKVYIDMNGNPAANAAYMKREPRVTIITLVECITPKDFVNRATKWGPRVAEDGTVLWYDDIHIRDIPRDLAGLGPTISGFISMHTTYYYDPQEISALLAWAPGAVWYASMHRFDGMHGAINDGEQTWEKTPNSFGHIVKQINVKTGEAYEHPDNSWWFEHDSRICGDQAFGWTMGELCEETYFFIATGVPVKQARMSSKCMDNKEQHRATSTGKAQSKQQMLQTREVVVSLYGATVKAPIDPRHVDLFDKMRTHLIAKPRGPKEYKDHVSRCKVAKSGMMSDGGVDIDAQQLADIARLSFMIDFEDQYTHDSTMFSTQYATQVKSDYLYKTGSGMVTMGTISALSEMLMDAVESKNLKQAGLRATRTGVNILQRRNVLNVVK